MFGVPLHRIIVYLPLVLALTALGYDLWARLSGTEALHDTGSRLLKWTVLALLLAVGTGFSLAGISGVGSRGIVTGHAALGGAAVLVLGVLAFVRYSAENRDDSEPWSAMWLVIETVGTLLVVGTAIIGIGM